MPADYNIDGNTLRDSCISSVNLLKAIEHRTEVANITAKVRLGILSEPDAARLCIAECTKGIDLLKTGRSIGSSEVLDVLSELYERRSALLNVANFDDLQHNRSTPTKIEKNVRQQFVDATAVIDCE